MSSASPSLNHSPYAHSDDQVHTGEAWATSADLDPWRAMILTLDGGGIRGYSSLLILNALMHQVCIWENKLETIERSLHAKLLPVQDLPVKSKDNEHENWPVPLNSGDAGAVFHEDQLLPCHYFDYMYGTSTGGLIATMLGRLRMSVPQCLEVYRSVGENLFGKRRSYIPLATKYHHRPLEVSVQDTVKKHCKQHIADESCPGTDWHPWENAYDGNFDVDFNSHICQSIALTAVQNSRIDEAYLLRTYSHVYQNIPNYLSPYNEGADELMIWQVTRATSAAPFYFKSLEAELRGETKIFKDGGIRENNPSGAAWSEFVSLYGEGSDPAVLLSIGTGRPDERKDGFASAWPGPFGRSKLVRKVAEKFAVFKNVLVKYTEGEKTHTDMLRLAKGEHGYYKRLNVSTGLESMPLDEWKRGTWYNAAEGTAQNVPGGATLSHMERVTADYLARDLDHRYDTYAPPRVMLEQLAEKLVRQRRARQITSRSALADNRKRWDTYMGKYMTGEYSSQADIPVVHLVKNRRLSK